MIFNLLKRKCPEKYIWSYPKVGSALIFLFVIIGMLILLPFKFGAFGFVSTIIFCFYCALISGIVYYAWVKLIKSNYKRTYLIIDDLFWTIFLLSTISISIYMYVKNIDLKLIHYLKDEIEVVSLFNSFLYTFCIGLPIYLIFFIIDFLVQHIVSEKAKKGIITNEANLEKVNDSLVENEKVDKEENKEFSVETKKKFLNTEFTILGKNNNEELKMLPQNFIYAQANGNYLNVVFYDKDQNIQNEIIRNSISKLVNNVSGYSFIIQVHRSSIVNLHYVKSIKGPIKNTMLKLEFKSEEVGFSVARSKVDEVKEAYNSFKNI